ncbi:hypothetical protein HYPSUDRAFT_383267 [Hypholoma sublateritium FD-334 SS-4]|uniref:Proteasome activator PA28 C-terminal domain-containing protein n=1 Tax=Hypholoma sublateritium (strain FD-334 SS-4) TaxID=945553 RepID=A0A0D2Q2P0_HYPSF|nr:hypothetical protein HYPSUDRAFT_383267 [Hypholoma sublateritium FD-334 SS-4]
MIKSIQNDLLQTGFNVLVHAIPQKASLTETKLKLISASINPPFLPSQILELQKINQVASNAYSPLGRYSGVITPSHSHLFAAELHLTPRKKRKHHEMLSDLAIQSTGSDPSDSLVSPERPGRGTEDISKYPTFSRPNTSGHNEIHATIKKECEYLIQLTDQARMWLILTQLRYGLLLFIDIGLSVNRADCDSKISNAQDDLLTEIQLSQQSALNMRDTARKYYAARAKLCSKVVKFPDIQDYLMALQEHDEQQLFLARQYLTDIQNIYMALFEMIVKTGILDCVTGNPIR